MEINYEFIFSEALSHSRREKLLFDTINTIDIKNFKNKTFDEIYISMHELCKTKDQLGPLTTYDLTSGICKYYNILIDKVFIVGNGPKRAIKILELESKIKKYYIKDLSLDYVYIKEVIEAFKNKYYSIDDIISKSNNGDAVESFLCKWQKNIN
jgi:hypothetical protein